MATKGRAQKGSRMALTMDTKMTNYSYKFDGGKVVGHLDLQYIVHKSVMRCILMEYRCYVVLRNSIYVSSNLGQVNSDSCSFIACSVENLPCVQLCRCLSSEL